MRSLHQPRASWPGVEAEEAKILRAMTPEESLGQYLALQAEFEPWLLETEPWFRQPRIESLIELQVRLLRLNGRHVKTINELTSAVSALQSRLDAAGVPSMVIGGLAVGVWGEPRLTRDVDMKVLLQRADRRRLLDLLADYRSLHADPDEALRRNGVAFFHDSEGVRIDVMLAETAFDEEALTRARRVEVPSGPTIRVCSAEDLIIYKLVSVRTQDRLDVEGILTRQSAALDDTYILKWLHEFEQALDDSTLVQEYRHLRDRFS